MMALLPAALTWAGPAAAQWSIGADATLASRYVWRGTTRAAAPVAQVATYLALDAGAAFVAVGVWGNIELRRADSGQASLVGTGRRGLGEQDVWAALSARSRSVDWALGLSRYAVDQPPGADTNRGDFATTELWLMVSAPHLPIIPRAGAWLDIDEVNGRYYELALEYPFKLNPLGKPFGSVFLAAEAGVSDGQSSGGAGAASYFGGDGLTHLDFAATLTLDLAPHVPGSLHLATHYQISHDAATRLSESGRRRGWWSEMSVSLTSARQRSAAGAGR